jgi:hypothetical protein
VAALTVVRQPDPWDDEYVLAPCWLCEDDAAKRAVQERRKAIRIVNEEENADEV